MQPSELLHPLPPKFRKNPTQGFGGNRAVYSKYKTVYGEPFAGHNGVDWGVPVGTPIVAMEGGVVERVSYDVGGFGLYMVVRSDVEKYRIWYAHTDAIFYAPGAVVTKGRVIAVSGNTGNSTGPHLHVTVKWLPMTNRAYGDAIDFKPLLVSPGVGYDFALPNLAPVATSSDLPRTTNIAASDVRYTHPSRYGSLQIGWCYGGGSDEPTEEQTVDDPGVPAMRWVRSGAGLPPHRVRYSDHQTPWDYETDREIPISCDRLCEP